MFKKSIISIISFLFVFVQIPYGFAYTATVLSDSELDSIHAGGLNLDFSSFLGSKDLITRSSSSNGLSTFGKETTLVVNQNGQLEPFNPTQPNSPNVIASPNIPTAPSTPVTTNEVNVPEVPSIPNSTDETAINNTDTQTITPITPLQPSTPEIPKLPITVDSFLSSNGKIGVMAFESVGEIKPISDVSSMATNSINISETAQQYLSAMNNINAAGSTVLVQQNLVILINSTVENLNNLNDLNMNNFMPSALQP